MGTIRQLNIKSKIIQKLLPILSGSNKSLIGHLGGETIIRKQIFILFLFYIFPGPSIANTLTTKVQNSILSTNKSNIKAKFEFETSENPLGSISDYEIKMDLKYSRMLTQQWGFALASEVSHENISDKNSSNSWNSLGTGFLYKYQFWGQKWKTFFLYNYIPNHKIRLKKQRNDFFETEMSTKIIFSDFIIAKLKIEYFLYNTIKNNPDVNLHKLKLELSPSVYLRKISLGLQNKWSHTFNVIGDDFHFTTAPFIKYENNIFESKLKLIYRPLAGSDGAFIAQNWTENPTLALDLELNY